MYIYDLIMLCIIYIILYIKGFLLKLLKDITICRTIFIYIYINNITTHHKVDLDPWNGRESNLQHSESI